jgi:hypothetical protein
MRFQADAPKTIFVGKLDDELLASEKNNLRAAISTEISGRAGTNPGTLARGRRFSTNTCLPNRLKCDRSSRILFDLQTPIRGRFSNLRESPRDPEKRSAGNGFLAALGLVKCRLKLAKAEADN